MPVPRRQGVCHAPGCDRQAIAKNLCMMHYKRQRSGRPLTDQHETPAYGEYGVLTTDGDLVQCHECGVWVRSLGNHTYMVHDETAREYKQRWGLPLSKPLTSPSLSATLSENAASRVGGEDWKRLEAARDPVAAAASRDTETMRHAARSSDPEVRRRNGRTTTIHEVRTCPICGAEWCPLPGTNGAAQRLLTCGRDECVREVQRLNALEQPRTDGAFGRLA